MNLYSIRDRAARAFGNPFVMANNATAMRVFEAEVNRSSQDNMLHQAPHDFELYCVGSFNIDTGLVEQNLELVCTGNELVRVPPASS